jgi:hypothetical protein
MFCRRNDLAFLVSYVQFGNSLLKIRGKIAKIVTIKSIPEVNVMKNLLDNFLEKISVLKKKQSMPHILMPTYITSSPISRHCYFGLNHVGYPFRGDAARWQPKNH